MNITHTINEGIWQPVVDRANTEAKAAHDRTEAAKPEKDRVEFTPKSLEEYFHERVNDVEGSYAKQNNDALLKDVLADPTQAARLFAVLSTPDLRQETANKADAVIGG